MNKQTATTVGWIWVSVLAGCATTSATSQRPANARTYFVDAHRPVAVGTRFRVEGRGEKQQQTETIDSVGRRISTDASLLRVEFAGDATVRSVNAEGYVNAVVIEVRRAVAEDGERSWTFVAPGTTLSIQSSETQGSPRVERDGAAVESSSVELLSLAYDLGHLYGLNASLFGSPARRAVGERWPVEGLRLMTSSSSAVTVTRRDGTEQTVRAAPSESASDGQAEATLEGVSRVDGVSCLSLHTTVRMGFERPDATMAARQSYEWGMLLPKSRRRAPLGMSSRSTIDSWAALPIDGQMYRNHLVGEQTMLVRFAEIQ